MGTRRIKVKKDFKLNLEARQQTVKWIINTDDDDVFPLGDVVKSLRANSVQWTLNAGEIMSTAPTAPRMGVDPEQVKAPKPAPGGWYELKLTGFKPKLDKSKQGVNYNAQFEIVNNTTENNGKRAYLGLSTKFARAHADFAHGLGFPLNPDGSIPGDWVPDDKDKNNVEKFQYKGPLIGKVMKAELQITSYQGNERNEINQIMCKVDGCATKFPEIRHMTKMISNK